MGQPSWSILPLTGNNQSGKARAEARRTQSKEKASLLRALCGFARNTTSLLILLQGDGFKDAKHREIRRIGSQHAGQGYCNPGQSWG